MILRLDMRGSDNYWIILGKTTVTFPGYTYISYVTNKTNIESLEHTFNLPSKLTDV